MQHLRFPNVHSYLYWYLWSVKKHIRLKISNDLLKFSEYDLCPCLHLPESFKTALSSMLDVSLLRDPAFMLIGVSNIFGMAGLYVPFVYIVDAARLSVSIWWWDMSTLHFSLVIMRIMIHNWNLVCLNDLLYFVCFITFRHKLQNTRSVKIRESVTGDRQGVAH